MNRLTVDSTNYSPAIDLDPDKLLMSFIGVSRPENVGLFYQQVLDWIADLSSEVNNPSTLSIIFKLEYCNSSSQKYLLIILEKLLQLKDLGLSLDIEWYYEEGDEKMIEDGEDIADAIGLSFKFIEM